MLYLATGNGMLKFDTQKEIYASAPAMELDGGKMIDCQLETPHLKSMGGRYISYEEYMEIMNED